MWYVPGKIFDISNEPVWVTAADEYVFAVSEDGHFLSVKYPPANTYDLDIHLEVDGPIVVDKGRSYFPSGSSLIMLNLDEMQDQ